MLRAQGWMVQLQNHPGLRNMAKLCPQNCGFNRSTWGEMASKNVHFMTDRVVQKRGFRPEISGKFHEENDDKPIRFWRLTTLFSQTQLRDLSLA